MAFLCLKIATNVGSCVQEYVFFRFLGGFFFSVRFLCLLVVGL